jgi:hypothetical protein
MEETSAPVAMKTAPMPAAVKITAATTTTMTASTAETSATMCHRIGCRDL